MFTGTMRTALAAAILLCAAAQANAQTPQAGQTVTPFPASFFAPHRAQTAREMVDHLPDFTLEEGRPESSGGGRPGNVLIDGKAPQLNGRTLAEVLRGIPARSVARIELIQGGATEAETHILVANVVVRRSNVIRGTVSATGLFQNRDRGGGSLNLTMQSRSDAGRTLDLSLNASRNPNSGALVRRERVSTTTGRVLSRTSQIYGGFTERVEARAGLDRPLAGGRLRLNLSSVFSAADNNDVSTNELTGVETRGASGSESVNHTAAVRYTRDVGEDTQLDARLTRNVNQAESNSFYGNRVFNSEREFDGWTSAVLLEHDYSKALTLRAGVDTDFDAQGGQSVTLVDGKPVSVPSAQTDAERFRTIGIVGANMRATPTLRLDAALRVDLTSLATRNGQNHRETFEALRPALLVTYAPTRQTEASLTLEALVDPVSLNNFVAQVDRNSSDDEDEIIAGNTRLIPQTSWLARARFQHRFGAGRLVLTATHVELEDVFDRIVITSVSPDPTRPGQNITRYFEAPGNIGSGERQDVAVDLDLPLDSVGLADGRLRLQTTWRDSELIDPFTGERRRFSSEAPFSWSANLSTQFFDGMLRTGLDASSGAASTSWRRSELTISDRQAYVSTFVEYRPTPELTARFEVRDLTSRIQTSLREIYSCTSSCGSARADGELSSTELRVSQAGPSFHLNVRRSF